MTTIQLRKKVHAIVDNADERLLKMVLAMMQEYESPAYVFTAEEKKEIYRRSKELRSGKVKGYTLEETLRSVRSAIKK
ncbi:MAG TPA: hypothetical protein VL651_16045 [Bacteroidia bacterium]|jgi:hypothetical protein|nr:hypothetical protein [Bacteroidia bacterium]